jgi:hypothetical protein
MIRRELPRTEDAGLGPGDRTAQNIGGFLLAVFSRPVTCAEVARVFSNQQIGRGGRRPPAGVSYRFSGELVGLKPVRQMNHTHRSIGSKPGRDHLVGTAPRDPLVQLTVRQPSSPAIDGRATGHKQAGRNPHPTVRGILSGLHGSIDNVGPPRRHLLRDPLSSFIASTETPQRTMRAAAYALHFVFRLRLRDRPGLNLNRTRTKCPLYPMGKAMPTPEKASATRPMSVVVAPAGAARLRQSKRNPNSASASAAPPETWTTFRLFPNRISVQCSEGKRFGPLLFYHLCSYVQQSPAIRHRCFDDEPLDLRSLATLR